MRIHQQIVLLGCYFLLLPSHNDGVLFRQSLSSYPNAVCTDGTPAAYYHTWAETEVDLRRYRNYVIYLDGGGYCPSVKDCHLRCSIARNLCTEPLAFMKDNHGILSDNPDNNPVMHGYYKVELPYCTGDMFIGRKLGSSDNDGLNFAGKIVFDGMIDSLKAKTNIARADNVVLSGSSAGGAGVAFLCEHLQDLLPHVRIWCVVDAAFFYPVTQPFNNTPECESIDKVLQKGAKLWGAPEVSHFQLQNWWNNFRSNTNVFLGIAKFDVFGFESFCGDFDKPRDLRIWNKGIWPLTIRFLSEQPQMGLFSAGCRYHMILHSSALFNRLKAGPNKITYAQALDNWIKGEPPSMYRIWDNCEDENFCNTECDDEGIPQQEGNEQD